MFYVLYVTPQGLSSTIHLDDYKRAYNTYIGFTGGEYSYAQFGGVGTGIIEDYYSKADSRFGFKEAVQTIAEQQELFAKYESERLTELNKDELDKREKANDECRAILEKQVRSESEPD